MPATLNRSVSDTMPRLRILLSAYACEPHRGSEPGVGWEWATRLAKIHDVTVITRANNREVIESALRDCNPEHLPKFIYVDLPAFWTRLKKQGLLPVSLYYIFWQLAARSTIQERPGQFDLIHHVTFNGFRFPGAWWRSEIPVVLGPLGGGSVASPHYKRCFGWRWLFEKVRECSVKHWRWNPWTVASLKNAHRVLVVGDELHQRFEAAGIRCGKMLETALPKGLEAEPEHIPAERKKDFVWVGNMEPWKAWQIAIEAYARARSEGLQGHRLKIIGSGRQLRDARRKAEELGVSGEVDFLGQQSREEVWRAIAGARALVFSSIRDTSGNVVLEAMGLRCPVICFLHQGVAMMTDDSCAIRVEPREWQAAVAGFARAMTTLGQDHLLAGQMGAHGRSRVLEHFTWEAKIARSAAFYGD